MVSFTQIAREVLEDGRRDSVNIDSNIKRLNRKFTKFVEAGGVSAEMLKDERSRMYFDESEVSFLKEILKQLDEERGFADAFMRKKESTDELIDVHDLIQSVIDSMEKNGEDVEYIKANVNMLDRIFLYFFRADIKYCHQILDALVLNFMPYPYTYQMHLMREFMHFLQHEFARSLAIAFINTEELAKFFKNAKEINEGICNISDLYGEENDDIKAEYCQCDVSIVQFLKANPYVRELIEKRLGSDLAEFWNLG